MLMSHPGVEIRIDAKRGGEGGSELSVQFSLPGILHGTANRVPCYAC